MKKLLGVPVVLILYWLGHLASKIFERTEYDYVYSVYNFCMIKSCDINDWCGWDFWHEVDEHENFGE